MMLNLLSKIVQDNRFLWVVCWLMLGAIVSLPIVSIYVRGTDPVRIVGGISTYVGSGGMTIEKNAMGSFKLLAESEKQFAIRVGDQAFTAVPYAENDPRRSVSWVKPSYFRLDAATVTNQQVKIEAGRDDQIVIRIHNPENLDLKINKTAEIERELLDFLVKSLGIVWLVIILAAGIGWRILKPKIEQNSF